MASSSSFINEWKYDVFLSFRGIDTRSGFTGSLHRALRGKEIKSFMDDQDLEKGAEINPALDEAIQNSRIALVVLSENYASSTFCLDELVKIMDCSKDKDMLVLPVFYEVEPCDVRYQKGKYGDALNKHEARITEKETIEKWRVALKKVANLSGWHFNHDKYEYELIDIIVQDIIKKIHRLRESEKDKIIVKGYDGLAAHLSEKSLVEQFNGISLAGNISGSLETNTTDPVYMKDRLAAYRITVEAAAAARIKAAFRKPSLKVRSQAIEFLSPQDEARHIVAAMKIQHAFRNFKSRKIVRKTGKWRRKFRKQNRGEEQLACRQANVLQTRLDHLQRLHGAAAAGAVGSGEKEERRPEWRVGWPLDGPAAGENRRPLQTGIPDSKMKQIEYGAAAAWIQHRFRTWKLRREFLHMRSQAIKIQAVFRGFQVRRQYRKIIWSVGVLEKAILRWRLKRKGFRGLQVNPVQEIKDDKQESDTEDEFFQTSRKQAEERVERAVVRVQAMFRSKKAQEEYNRMKLAHSQAKLELEFEEFLNSEVDMLTKI